MVTIRNSFSFYVGSSLSFSVRNVSLLSRLLYSIGQSVTLSIKNGTSAVTYLEYLNQVEIIPSPITNFYTVLEYKT